MMLRNTESGKERADFVHSLLENTANTGAMPTLTKENSRRCRA